MLLLCFFLSGLAALIYQTAWMRQFGLLFGTSELAVATVLAAYMGGLALGAALIERWLPRIRRLVRAYALLEAGIALSAIALVPILLAVSGGLLTEWFGGQPQPPSSENVSISAFYLLAAFVALAVPTTLMGATLPLLARHAVRSESQIGSRIGAFYAINTAGAVAGALLAAYVLLPELGLKASTWVGAAINGLVFLLAAASVKASSTGSPPATNDSLIRNADSRATAAWRPGSNGWILPLMLLSGAVAFFYEVLWARLLSHLIGGSIHAFAVMVASFLAGIAIGGGLGAVWARDRKRAESGFVIAQILVALTGAAAYLYLLSRAPFTGGLANNSWFGFLLLLPMTIAIGVTYPLAVRILANSPEQAASASARVYAWNTIGAILGSIVGGFWLIPYLRYEGSVRLGVFASAMLAISALWLVARPRLVIASAATAALIAGAVAFQPPVPTGLLLTSPLNIANNGRILHYSVGRSASVVVLAQDGGLALRTNGLPEALMDSPGLTPRFSGEFWLAPLASITRPAATDMLVVGYGGGVVIEAVAPSIRRIDVIELEPEVVAANQATRQLRKRDPLADPRLNIIVNDARGALQLTTKKYDVIVSQPSHPWTAGASHLYTQEFMELAKSKLQADGVFIQWMNAAFVNESLLRSLARTIREVFGELRIYRPDPATMVFVAGANNLAPEQRLLSTGVPLSLSPAHYSRYGISSVEDLIAALAVDEQGAAQLTAGAPLITDDRNRIATSTVFNAGEGLTSDQTGRLLAAYDPLQRTDSWIYRDLRDRLAWPYIVRRNSSFMVLDSSLMDRSRRIVSLLGGGADARMAALYLRIAQGDTEGARRMAAENASLSPTDARAQYLRLQAEVTAVNAAELSAELTTAIAALPAGARATLLGRHALARRDYSALAAMDSDLATAVSTDPWRIDATMLRADWRTHVANSEKIKGFSDEAIEMLDRDTMLMPSPAALSLRLAAALNADRPQVALESVDSLINWDRALLTRSVPNEQRRRIAARLNQLQPVLEQLAKRPLIDSYRMTEVREKLQQTIANATQ